MNWRCKKLPWHKQEFVRRILTSPNDWMLYRCSCGRMYAANHASKKVMPWTEAVQEFYLSASRDSIARLEMALVQVTDVVKKQKASGEKGEN